MTQTAEQEKLSENLLLEHTANELREASNLAKVTERPILTAPKVAVEVDC